MQLIGFQLGREWKLSIAEIQNVFPEAKELFSASGIYILQDIEKGEILEKAKLLGGTIKIFELEFYSELEDIYSKIISDGHETEGKFKYSLNMFGEKFQTLEKVLKKTKLLLKKEGISSRYFNKDDGKNLSSAQILGNSILKKGHDYNLVHFAGVYYFGETIWVQDIDAYSKRDYSKSRDMQVGMLPPKLCQIMINLGNTSTDASIYDPFVGLGTVLIEALARGNTKVYGSDLSDSILKEAEDNIKNFIEKNNIINFDYYFEKLNAKFIHESSILGNKKIGLIVTEGYLGEVMTRKNISFERIQKQRDSLSKLYSAFFENLAKFGYKGDIVMCFPFWEFNGKTIYFTELHEILRDSRFEIQSLFKTESKLSTKTGSLTYKRKSQFVGREIYKLKLQVGNS